MINPGDIYKSKDRREQGRYVKVIGADWCHAYCVPCAPDGREISSRKTRILVENLQRRFERVDLHAGGNGQ